MPEWNLLVAGPAAAVVVALVLILLVAARRRRGASDPRALGPRQDESVEAPGDDENVKGSGEDEAGRAPDQEESVEVSPVDEAGRAPDQEESVEASRADKATRAPDEEESVEVSRADEATRAPAAAGAIATGVFGAAGSDEDRAGGPEQGETDGDPEEQPFERDGRWWFRRDGELLVFDDDAQQWEPSAASPRPASGDLTGPTQTESDDAAPTPSGAGTTTLTRARRADIDVDAYRNGSAGFWKCSSCGAVNGSIADACRMCFTRRPRARP